MPTSENFQKSIEHILTKDQRYHPEAYFFLRSALEFTIKNIKKNRHHPETSHVSAAQLLDGFRQLALQEFGPMAITVLEFWGIHSCLDIGNATFHLIESGAFGKSDQDSIDQFKNGFDFHDAFVKPFQPNPASTPPTTQPHILPNP